MGKGKGGRGRYEERTPKIPRKKVVQLLGSESQGWSQGEVFRSNQICNFVSFQVSSAFYLLPSSVIQAGRQLKDVFFSPYPR